MLTVNARQLELALTKALDVVALGNKTAAPTVTVSFTKEAVRLAVSNQAAAYVCYIDAKVENYKKSPAVQVVPTVMLSYVKGRKAIKMVPENDGLTISGTGGLKAKLIYVGDSSHIEDIQPENDDNKMTIHGVGVELLKDIESMKDRTEQKPMSGQLRWSSKNSTIEIIAGDTHHLAHLVRHKVKSKKDGAITLPFASLKRILTVGGEIYRENNVAIAINAIEALQLNNLAEAEAINIDEVRAIYSEKAKGLATVPLADLTAAIEALAAGTESNTSIKLAVDEAGENMLATVKTGAAKASIKIKLSKAGKKFSANIQLTHLYDCTKCIRSKNVMMNIKGNNLHLQGVHDTDELHALIALVPE